MINVAPGKTSILVVRGPPPSDSDAPTDLHGVHIPIVDDYKYLGGRPFNAAKSLAERISLTWLAIRRLSPVWQCRSCPLRQKLLLLRSLATSILLYCCECWTLSIARKADTAFARMLKYVLQDFHSSTIDLMARCQLPFISSIAAERQILAIGHALRMPCPLHSVLHHRLPLARSAPLHRLLRRRIPYPQEEWVLLAYDRKNWAALAASVAHDHEESCQLLLLRARRRRLDPVRVENRVYLMILEGILDAFHDPTHRAHLIRPYAMHEHQNVFGGKKKKW